MRAFRLRICSACSLAIAALLLACAPAGAQFIGYTSPQTVNQKAFAAVSSPSTFVVQNVGQSQHEVCYESTDANAIFQLRIEASFDGATYLPLSDDATSQSSGCIFGQGSYPFVRVNLLSYSTSASGTLTAYYTGTSATSFPMTGSLNQSQQFKKILSLSSSTTLAAYSFAPPCANTSGAIYFQYNSGNAEGGEVGVQSGTDSLHLSEADTGGLFTILNNTIIQIFPIPASPATFIKTTIHIPAGANYTAQYIFSCPAPNTGYAAQVVQGLLQPIPAQNEEFVSASGASTGFSINSTAPQSPYLFSLSARCSAGTSGLTIANTAGTTLWSSGPTEVGATTFKFQWNPGLTSAIGDKLVVTLASCGSGNTGTLDIQASTN